MMVTGISVAGLGGVAAIFGVFVYAFAIRCESDSNAFLSTSCERHEPTEMVGLGMIIGGLLGGAGIGVPLAVVGAKKVERGSAKIVPHLQVGPMGGSLTWTF